MTRKYMTIPAVVAGALGMSNAVASAAEPTADELMKQIEALQAKVQQLEVKQQQAISARDVDATVDKVLRDAEKRSQLLQMEGFTAGWDNGFKLQSANGDFLLQPYFQFQFRNTTNFVDSTAVFDDDDDIVGFSGEDQTQNGFEIRRMKFGVKGNAFTPDLTYNFRWATRSSGGNLVLEQATIQYQFVENWAFKVGQFKDHWTHEETTSSERQLAVDRSLMNELIGGGLTDYVQGVVLLYNPADSALRGEVAYHDGLNTDNTDWQEGGGGISIVDPNWGVSARIEYKVMGDWKAYNDFTAMGTKEDLLVVGGGMDFTQGGSQDVWLHTIDAQYENAAGLGIYGAFVGNWIDGGPTDDDFYNWGFLVQAGYMLNEKLEVFGRFDYTKFDFDTVTGRDDFSEATVGVNYYFRGHAAKFTLDFTWLFNGAPENVPGIGVLASDDDEFVIRGQFQLLL